MTIQIRIGYRVTGLGSALSGVIKHFVPFEIVNIPDIGLFFQNAKKLFLSFFIRCEALLDIQ